MAEVSSEYIRQDIDTNLPETSRYFLSDIYESDGIKFFETWNVITVPISSEDEFYTIPVGEEGRWDLIAHKKLKTVLNWWILCLANNIKNPLEIIPAGTVIRIPSESTVYDITVNAKVRILESRKSK